MAAESPKKQTQFPKRPKMNVNAFLQKDYENEPPSGPKKTNPKQSQFLQRPKSLAKKSRHTRKNLDLGLSLIFLTMTLE